MNLCACEIFGIQHRRTRKNSWKCHLCDFNNCHTFRIAPFNRDLRFFPRNASLFHMQRNIRTTVSRTMKLHFRKSNRGPYECANNGTTHFLREYILTISNRSRTCRQANTRDSTDMYGSTYRKSTNSRFFRISLALLCVSKYLNH